MSSIELKENFGLDCSEKVWSIIRRNIEEFDEIEEWQSIISKGVSTKVKIDKKLFNLIKVNVPEKIDLESWKIWTKNS